VEVVNSMKVISKEEAKTALWELIPHKPVSSRKANSYYRACISTSMGVCNKCCEALAGEVSLKIEDVRT